MTVALQRISDVILLTEREVSDAICVDCCSLGTRLSRRRIVVFATAITVADQCST